MASLYDRIASPFDSDLPRSPLAQLRQQMRQEMFSVEPSQPEFTQAQADSLLRQAGGKLLGGAAYLGGSLDKGLGARAIRGLLAGKPSELLSLIPFSDTLGITDPSQSVGGRELLEKAGVLGPNKPGFDAGDLVGFGAEVLLDPATYLTLGASSVGKAGKAAKLAGVLPKSRVGRITTTLDDILKTATPQQAADITANLGGAANVAARRGEKLGGLLGVGLPFRDPLVTFGTGSLAQKVAGGMDKMGAALRYSAPGRGVAALFHAPAQGLLTKEGQIAAEQAFAAARQYEAEGLGNAADYITKLQQSGALGDSAHVARLRQAIEGVATNAPEQGLADEIAKSYERMGTDEWSLGADISPLKDKYGRYGARYITEPAMPAKGIGHGKRVFKTKHKSMDARDPFLKNIQGVTESINEIARTYGNAATEAVATKNNKALNAMAVDVAKKYLGLADDELTELPALKRTIQEHNALTPGVVKNAVADVNKLESARTAVQSAAESTDDAAEQLSRFADPTAQAAQLRQIKDMAEWSGLAADVARAKVAATTAKLSQAHEILRWLPKLDPEHRAAGVFMNHPVADYLRRSAMHARSKANMEALHDLFVKNADAGGADAVSLVDAMKKSGIGGEGGLARMYERLGLGSADDILSPLDPEQYKEAIDALKSVTIPKHIADDAVRLEQSFSTPEAWGKVLDKLDQITTLTKSSLTTIFPGFHARNAATGVWMNNVIGAFGFKSYGQVWKLLHGKKNVSLADVPAFQGMSQADAVREFQKLAMQWRIADITQVSDIPQLVEQGSTVAGAAKTQTDKLVGRLPGEVPESLREIAKSVRPKSLAEANPLNQTGVAANADIFAPVAAGRRLGNLVEQTNRLAGFLELLKKGWAPDVAAAKIRAAHVDYKLLTPFEKSVMRRVIPFYSFSRAMVPHTLSELAQHPGGKVAQAIRFQNTMRDQEGFTPDYLGGGLAIPLGGEQGGIQRYLTQFDLPHEILNDLVQVGRGGAQKTGLSALGQVNPLIKGPLELATGKQFFSGRELRDLDPRIGRLAYQAGLLSDPRSSETVNALDQIVMNSPLSRVVSTVGQLADERKPLQDKAINLLTGVRISSVDMDKQRELESRKQLENLLRGRPGVSVHESLYVPKDEKGKVSERDLHLMQALQAIHKRAQKQRRAKEKAG